MVTAEIVARPARQDALRTILLAGLVAGILDGSDAAIFSGVLRGAGVSRVFQFIASGVLGPDSFHGGWATVSLGVAFHLVIATSAAAAYYGLTLAQPALLHRPALCGLFFGMAVFCLMHYVVVPLSAVPRHRTATPDYLNLVFSHIFFVGLPIARLTSRSARRR